MSTNVPAVIEAQQAVVEAKEAGNNVLANQAYQRELAVRRGEQAASDTKSIPFERRQEAVEYVFGQLAPLEEPDQIAMLRDEWAGDAWTKLSITQKMLMDHPDLTAMAERFGVVNHPAFLAVAALVAEKSGYRLSPAGAQSPGDRPSLAEPPVSPGDALAFEDQLAELRSKAKDAQDAHDSRRANHYYMQEQALLASRDNRPAVGGRGRNA